MSIGGIKSLHVLPLEEKLVSFVPGSSQLLSMSSATMQGHAVAVKVLLNNNAGKTIVSVAEDSATTLAIRNQGGVS